MLASMASFSKPNPVFNRSANGVAVGTRRATRAGARLTQRYVAGSIAGNAFW